MLLFGEEEAVEGNEIIPYIEPIYRFFCRRLSQRYDAEDLASEIVCHVLDGFNGIVRKIGYN